MRVCDTLLSLPGRAGALGVQRRKRDSTAIVWATEQTNRTKTFGSLPIYQMSHWLRGVVDQIPLRSAQCIMTDLNDPMGLPAQSVTRGMAPEPEGLEATLFRRVLQDV